MIIAHAIIGTMPIENHFSWFWLLGSVIPDIDHIFVILKNRLFSINKLIDSIINEEKYGIKYKTKYFHSVSGGLLISMIVSAISFSGGVYFFSGYMLHLGLDFLDKDEKQYFYPLKIKTKGWLPIFSKPEIIFTIILLLISIKIYV